MRFLCGQILQELQHCWLPWTLPGVPPENAMRASPHRSGSHGSGKGRVVLFLFGMTGYGLGSVLIDPRSRPVSLGAITIDACPGRTFAVSTFRRTPVQPTVAFIRASSHRARRPATSGRS